LFIFFFPFVRSFFLPVSLSLTTMEVDPAQALKNDNGLHGDQLGGGQKVN
jgi:hypothetical protein